jgi:hypothetical protein
MDIGGTASKTWLIGANVSVQFNNIVINDITVNNDYLNILVHDPDTSMPANSSSIRANAARPFFIHNLETTFNTGPTKFVGQTIFQNPEQITFGSNWKAFTPVFSLDTGAITNVSVAVAEYIQIGPIIFFTVRMTCNVSGPFYYLYMNLPVNSSVGTFYGPVTGWGGAGATEFTIRNGFLQGPASAVLQIGNSVAAGPQNYCLSGWYHVTGL